MLEFIFEFIVEGIVEITKNLKMHPVLKIIISITGVIVFSVLFIWLMIKLGVWK